MDYFVTNNNAVSRGHADIITRGNRYFVRDLNSKNKTYINGQAIPPQCECELLDGSRLTLGNEEFIFNIYISPLGGVFGIYELLPAFLFSLAACVVVSLATPAPGADIEANHIPILEYMSG